MYIKNEVTHILYNNINLKGQIITYQWQCYFVGKTVNKKNF